MAMAEGAQALSLMSFTRQLVRREGPSVLYAGLKPSLISVIPYFAVRFGTYDILLRW